jgi:hypothetical protein
MGAPLYFCPGRKVAEFVRPGYDRALRREALAEVGLGAVLADVETLDQLARDDLTGLGPGQTSGCLLCAWQPATEPPTRTSFQPACQDWTEIVPGKLWLGLDKFEPTRPEDLLRHSGRREVDGRPLPAVAGHAVRLGDRRDWTVPVVRRPAFGHGVDGTGLPQVCGWDPEGKFTGQVRPEYAALWEASARLVPVFFDGGDEPLEWLVAQAVEALAINYRVDRALASALGLLDSQNWEAVAGAMVDIPTFRALAARQKKTENATATSSV